MIDWRPYRPFAYYFRIFLYIKDVSDLVDDLPEKQKKAILGLIDVKVDNEMKAVIEKLDHLEKGLDKSIDTVEKSISTVEKMLSVRFSVLLGAISLLALLIAIFKFIE